MSQNKPQELQEQASTERTAGVWEKNSKKILYAAIAVIVIAGGYLGYKNFIVEPKERKAAEELFTAESFFRKDSFALALNGNATVPGFLKVIKKYDGTDAANLARLYAGECYLQTGEFNKAIDMLEDFNPKDAKQVEAKTEGLLGDAYAELKKNDEAIQHYKNAGTLFADDQAISSEYLFRGGLLAAISGKTAEAVALYTIIKEKYPRTEKGFVVEKYLARLGAVK